MLRYANYDIVFLEVPNEVTLAVNIAGCPRRCRGCHSPHLQEDSGDPLTGNVLSEWLAAYGKAITCVCFMGGDREPEEVLKLAKIVRQYPKKTAWYSGNAVPCEGALPLFDFIKLGHYVDTLGALDSPDTNQRFYSVENGKMIDRTAAFWPH
ncbi:MAG: anaerobic ribonucleoside-triphosphate reductase activating protein, partial [Bacteroidales bacterium]|nr:anaerobic ribonucleoside-triphosphate reductase activating protein [Bacteroidales bacterium]